MPCEPSVEEKSFTPTVTSICIVPLAGTDESEVTVESDGTELSLEVDDWHDTSEMRSAEVNKSTVFRRMQ